MKEITSLPFTINAKGYLIAISAATTKNLINLNKR